VPIVADYKAIMMGHVRLRVGGDTDRTFEFDLPKMSVKDVPVMVTFFLISSNDLRMRIDLNGALVSDRQYTTGPERAIQDLVTSVTFPRDFVDNKLTFAVLQGEVHFSDVVLWFQRNT
jgi:hypothetical protein